MQTTKKNQEPATTNEAPPPNPIADALLGGGTFVLECLVDRVRFSVIGAGSETDILRDTSRVVMTPRGPEHPAIVEGKGINAHDVQKRVVMIELTKGQRVTLPRSALRDVWSFHCSECAGLLGDARAALCRDEEHRAAGHWQISGGKCGPRQVRVVGESYKLTPQLAACLESEARILAGADPSTVR